MFILAKFPHRSALMSFKSLNTKPLVCLFFKTKTFGRGRLSPRSSLLRSTEAALAASVLLAGSLAAPSAGDTPATPPRQKQKAFVTRMDFHGISLIFGGCWGVGVFLLFLAPTSLSATSPHGESSSLES